jgi:ATP diphosphatase
MTRMVDTGRSGAEERARAVAAEDGDALRQAVAIMALLRSAEGCPWDREQTFDSIKRHTLEETYEVFDAIERRNWPDLKDELGDLLLQVLFYAQMAAEAGHFGMEEVAANLVAKLIRRHPHVFGDAAGVVTEAAVAEAAAGSAGAVLRNWEQIKRAEKRAEERESILAEVPRSMPAMMEAGKLGSKAAKVGFDWPHAGGLVAKLREEIGELEAEMISAGTAERKRAAIEEEFGDLLFTGVNLGRHLGLDCESALRLANAKFRARFGAMEREAGGVAGMEACTPEEMDALWERAKAATKAL